MSCVYDEVDGDRRIFERLLVDCRPMKGSNKLLNACRRDIDLIAADGRKVFAVFDADRIRSLLRLPADATDAEVLQEILERKEDSRLEAFLLERNLETVIEQIRECDSAGSISDDLFQRALEKQPHHRDLVFKQSSAMANKTMRSCVLDMNSSLRRIVMRISYLVSVSLH